MTPMLGRGLRSLYHLGQEVLTNIFDPFSLQSVNSPLQHLVLHISELVRSDERAGAVSPHAPRVGSNVSVPDALVVLGRGHYRHRFAIGES